MLRDPAGSITQESEFARAASKALARLTLLRLAVREAEKLITPEHGAAHPRETDGPGGAWLCRMEEIFPRALDEDGLAKVMATRRDQIRDIMRDERTRLTAQMVQTFRLHLKVIGNRAPGRGKRFGRGDSRRGGAPETPLPQAHQNSAGGWGEVDGLPPATCYYSIFHIPKETPKATHAQWAGVRQDPKLPEQCDRGPEEQDMTRGVKWLHLAPALLQDGPGNKPECKTKDQDHC